MVEAANNAAPPNPSWPDDVVADLVERGVMVPVCKRSELMSHMAQPLFLQRGFTVEKSDGSDRPIHDLQPLNSLLEEPPKTRLPSLEAIGARLSPGDWLASFDLRHAYHGVLLSEEASRMCALMVGDVAYRVRALPFGLSWSPFVFQTISSTVARLAAPGAEDFVYLDDVLVLQPGASREQHGERLRLLLAAYLNAGFTIKWAKCQLDSVHRLRFLGLDLDSAKMVFGVPVDKACRARGALAAVFGTRTKGAPRWPPSLRRLAAAVGYAGHLRLALPIMDSLLRPAIFYLVQQLRQVDAVHAEHLASLSSSRLWPRAATVLGRAWASKRYDRRPLLWPPPPEVLEPVYELRASLRRLPEAPCAPPTPAFSVWSDASEHAAGTASIRGDFAVDGGDTSTCSVLSSASHPFDTDLSALPQSHRETTGLLLGLQQLLDEPAMVQHLQLRPAGEWTSVRCVMDAQATIGAVRRGASRSQSMHPLVDQVTRLAFRHRLLLRFSWLPSAQMTWTDALSRPTLFSDLAVGWASIDPPLLRSLVRQTGLPEETLASAVDLHGWPWMSPCPRAVSPSPAPGAIAWDVLSTDVPALVGPTPLLFCRPPPSDEFITKLLKVSSSWPNPRLMLLPLSFDAPWWPTLAAQARRMAPLPTTTPWLRLPSIRSGRPDRQRCRPPGRWCLWLLPGRSPRRWLGSCLPHAHRRRRGSAIWPCGSSPGSVSTGAESATMHRPTCPSPTRSTPASVCAVRVGQARL
jgi:hypothetical protein